MMKKLGEGDTWSRSSGLSARTVQCVSGKVWITLERDLRDYTLGAGSKQTFPARGLLVIAALENSVVVMITEAAARRGRFSMWKCLHHLRLIHHPRPES